MNIFRLLLELFFLYLLYKVIFDFIIPVYRATRQMKDKIRETRQNMDHEHPLKKEPSKKVPEGDYIDYEEIK